MASTSTLLVAASNLVNGSGLAPNVATTTLGETINSEPIIASYSILQEGTEYGNVLQDNSLSVESLNLPSFVSNSNIAIESISAQRDRIFPDAKTFASILLSIDAFATYASKTYASIDSFSDTSFDSLGINVDSHQSAVTNGISSLFGGSATDATQIKTNMGLIASALENLGNLFDATVLGKLGDPATFIKHLMNSGFDFMPPTGWEAMTPAELQTYLNGVGDPLLQRVLLLSKFTPPAGARISSLGDLLDLSKVFPAEVVDLIPDNNFAGLSNMFVNLGGKFKSFTDVSTMLTSIEIPSLPNLSSYAEPISSSDVSALTSNLGTGEGTYGNPVLSDMLGSVSGSHVADLTQISTALTSIASRTNTQTLVTKLDDLATACAGGDSGEISTAFSDVQTAATAFKSDAVVTSLGSANTAITNILSRIDKENTNIELADINIAAASGSGTAAILSFVNNLHDYGVDRNNLKYNEFFSSMVQQNAGGDAILAALAEGKNMDIQARYAVPIGTKTS